MSSRVVDNKYEIVRSIGEGAMGAVYEAVHTGTQRRVALKLLVGDLFREASIVERFRREARAAGGIESQHVVHVLDSGVDEATNHPYLAMELLTGEDAAALIQRCGALPEDVALRIVAQACLGLQKAHERNIVHRDVKSANLFLARRGGGEVIVKVLDFGMAKIRIDRFDPAAGKLTRTGSILGSPDYMSPEQAKGLKDVDERSDVWSLGAVLYELLSGRAPFHHIESVAALIVAICRERPPSVREVAPWLRPEVCSVVERALQHEPAARFVNAGAMFEAIRPLLSGGWALTESMLVGRGPSGTGVAAESERDDLAATVALPPGAPDDRSTSSPDGPEAGRASVPEAHSWRGPPAGVVAQRGANATNAKPGGVGAVLLVGTCALAAAGGGAYYAWDRYLRAPAPSTSPTTTATAESIPKPPPTVAASVPPPPTASAAPEIVMRKLVVLPSNATVEVDGAPAAVMGGAITLTGPLDSTRRVVVRLGKREVRREVRLLEQGADPPVIDVNAK